MAANRRRTEGLYQSLPRSGGYGLASEAAECGNGSVDDDGGKEAEKREEKHEEKFGIGASESNH